MTSAFAFDDAELPVREEVRQELEREWDRLAGPGAWFTGTERVHIAAEARAARRGSVLDAGTGLDEAVVEAAQAVAAAPQHIRRDWVEDLAARGLRVEAYTEVIGVVARLSAVDAYSRGVGAGEPTLSEPRAGEPSRVLVEAAEHRRAFVPTVRSDNALDATGCPPPERHLPVADVLGITVPR